MKRLLGLAAAGLALAGVAASGAAAQGDTPFTTTSAFLCYSKFQVDPGVWPIYRTSYRVHDTAADLLAQGYWAPYAETGVPTATRITGGYYLTCSLPASMQSVGAQSGSATAPQLVSQKGNLVAESSKLAGVPGYYPLAP